MISFIAGLDLGQQEDPSTLAIAERKDDLLNVRHLHRWPLGTSYPTIINDIAKLYSRPPLAGSVLVLDATGVGRPVLDGLRAKGVNAHIVAVIITSGFQTARTRGCITVPKSDLVGALRMVLGTARLKIASKLPLAKACQRELENFTLKVSEKGLEQYGNADTTTHDDLVIALALLSWYGSRRKMETPLRTFTIRTKRDISRVIMIAGQDDLDSLPIDKDTPTVVLSFVDSLPTAAGKIIGRHRIKCTDNQPDEVHGSWTEEDQQGLLSAEQAKALWLWLFDPGVLGWQQLVIVDEGGTDRRALSAGLALADTFRVPRSSVLVQGEDDEVDMMEMEAPNGWVYSTIKRGRLHVVG